MLKGSLVVTNIQLCSSQTAERQSKPLTKGMNLWVRLEAEDPDISHRSCWRLNTARGRVNIGLTFIRGLKTPIQMNANIAACLLDV